MTPLTDEPMTVAQLIDALQKLPQGACDYDAPD